MIGCGLLESSKCKTQPRQRQARLLTNPFRSLMVRSGPMTLADRSGSVRSAAGSPVAKGVGQARGEINLPERLGEPREIGIDPGGLGITRNDQHRRAGVPRGEAASLKADRFSKETVGHSAHRPSLLPRPRGHRIDRPFRRSLESDPALRRPSAPVVPITHGNRCALPQVDRTAISRLG